MCFSLYRFSNVHKLEEHLTTHHILVLQIETFTFDSLDDFYQWKEEEEVHTSSWYVQKCAPQLINEKEHHYYYFNRAGKYRSQSKGERSLKSQGTSKVVSHCCAHIHATINKKTNVITVHYNSTHYNHETQLGHVRITDTTRMTIAAKLKEGKTPQRILDNIRDNTETHIVRKHLVNRKDINNIRNQFNIDGIQRHRNDLLSVTSWVKEMEMLPYNPVLLFKQHGDQQCDSYPYLEPDDFLLLIQTEFQHDMLCSHAHSGVCMDTTYKVSDYDFNLITLLILHEFQEGIPVAWALSNREDRLVLVHILQALKNVCGPLQPTWFMSDMAPQYSHAWKDVFGENKTAYLWCAWHVDRAWRDGIRRYVPMTQQKHIYHYLRVLLMETRIPKFRTLLAQFLTLCDSIAPAFATYFKSQYCTHIGQWTTICYRVGTPMNTNMYSESFH